MKINRQTIIFVSIAGVALIFPFNLNSQVTSRLDDLLYLVDPQAKISMDFKDASLQDILKIFSIQAKLNFLATEAVKDRRLTIYLDQVPVKDAMNKIFKANNLTYELDPDSSVFIIKETGVVEIDTITKTYFIKYARLGSSKLGKQMGDGATGGIVEAIKNILSEKGKISEDPRTNRIMVTDVPSRFPLIDQVFASLDIPTPQVMIEVEMIDTTKETLEQLGITWPSSWMSRTGKWIDAHKIIVDTIRTEDLTATLELLKQHTDTKYLARPRLVTLSNETAELKITTNEAIGKSVESKTENNVTTYTEKAERAETGVSLKVTPQVNTLTKEITLYIEPAVKEARATSFQLRLEGGYLQDVKDPEERSTKSIVKINDGQTLIIGGLIRHTDSVVERKVPFLGDIPILGTLFRHKNEHPQDRELIIFLTPHILMDEPTKEIAHAPAGGLSIQGIHEQGVIERKDLIDRTLNQYDN